MPATPIISALLSVLQLAQSSDSLTLDQALARARAGRPQIVAAAASVSRAHGTRRVAGVIPNPSTQFESDRAAPTHKITVVQPLSWLPRRSADLAAGRAVVARAVADSAQLVAEVGREVRRAFFGAVAADELLRLATEQSAIADSLVRIADRRVEAGDISALERDQVAQEASRTRLARLRAREGELVARTELARAVAWATGVEPRPAGVLDDGLDGSDVDRVSTVALERLPALRMALADSAAATARLRSARLAQIPIPGLVAGREWAGGARLGGDNVILGLALPMPLWSQGRELVAEARGAAAVESARAGEARLTVGAQLAAARARAVESATRARFARDSLLPEARRIRGGAVRLYDAGRTGILPVFDALRAERDVAEAVVQELLAFQDARAELLARLGRWE